MGHVPLCGRRKGEIISENQVHSSGVLVADFSRAGNFELLFLLSLLFLFLFLSPCACPVGCSDGYWQQLILSREPACDGKVRPDGAGSRNPGSCPASASQCCGTLGESALDESLRGSPPRAFRPVRSRSASRQQCRGQCTALRMSVFIASLHLLSAVLYQATTRKR